jgi:hypothetical protein
MNKKKRKRFPSPTTDPLFLSHRSVPSRPGKSRRCHPEGILTILSATRVSEVQCVANIYQKTISLYLGLCGAKEAAIRVAICSTHVER